MLQLGISNLMNNKKAWMGLYIGIIIVISVILTIPSMWLIKNTPGNSFKTDIELIATALLVFILWSFLMAFCIWLVKSSINARKLRKNPSSADAIMRIKKKNKDLKTISTAKRIAIGFLNVACIYLLIIISLEACVFSGLGTPLTVGWIIFVIANVCILVLLLVCAISDLAMMIRIHHNPYNQKALNLRKKGKKVFGILIILYILLYSLMLTYLLLYSH